MNFLKVFILLFFFISNSIYAFDFNKKTEPLEANQAFKVNINKNNTNNSLDIFIEIAKNHYIYENSLKIEVNNYIYQNYNLNKEEINDNFYGLSFVLKEPQNIIIKNLEQIKNIKITFQGCSPEFNLCYPYQTIKKDINNISIEKDNIFINKIEIISNDLTFFENLELKFKNSDMIIKVLIFFLIGVLISFTPCILPMIPIISAIILSKNNLSKNKALYLSSMYVIGSALSYGFIGFISAYSTQNIQSYFQSDVFILLAAGLLFILSLSLFDIFNLSLFNGFNNFINSKISKISNNGFNIILIGFLSSLIISPCVAAPLAGIILYTSTLDNLFLSFLYLFIFGIGSGLILIIVSTSLNKYKPKTGSYMNSIKYIMGFILVMVSIYILNRIINNEIILYLYNFTILLFGLFFISKLKKGNFKIIFTISLFLLAAQYIINNYIYIQTYNQSNILNFEEIKENTVIDKNKSIIKVTADWCIYCKQLDNEFYNNIEFKDLLNKYKLYKIDLTTTEDYEANYLKQNNIIGAPAIIIYKDDEIVFKFNGKANKYKIKDLIK